MQESKSLLQLQNRGSILFVYSDKMHIYVIYHDLEGDGLYKFVLDKQLVIESVHELDAPDRFKAYSEIHWHKPIHQSNGCLAFPGAVTVGKDTYTFVVNDMDVLQMSAQTCPPHVFALLPMDSLQDIEVEFHIQKSNTLYAIGYHKETHDQVFVTIDLAHDAVLRKYTLYSGLGEVIANTINIDRTDGRVYIGGLIRDPETRETVRPYFEQFLLLSD
jgi:hypothetical protein